MRRAAITGESGFQFRHFRPQDELAMLQHIVQAAAQFVLDAGLLGLEVEEGNLCHVSS